MQAKKWRPGYKWMANQRARNTQTSPSLLFPLILYGIVKSISSLFWAKKWNPETTFLTAAESAAAAAVIQSGICLDKTRGTNQISSKSVCLPGWLAGWLFDCLSTFEETWNDIYFLFFSSIFAGKRYPSFNMKGKKICPKKSAEKRKNLLKPWVRPLIDRLSWQTLWFHFVWKGALFRGKGGPPVLE